MAVNSKQVAVAQLLNVKIVVQLNPAAVAVSGGVQVALRMRVQRKDDGLPR